jgi:flavin-dependent dehydrogenase
MTGVRPPSPFTYKMATVFEEKHGIPLTFGMVPRAAGEDTFWVFIGGPADDRIDYVQAFQHIMTKSPFVSWYQNAQLSDRQSAVINFWSPIEEPFRDNVLIIGDAAWCIEAEITGAIMCGWKAAQAVTVALRDNKPNREGVGSYLAWWKESFLKYDYKGYLKSLAMFYVLTEEDARYVFSLLSKPLPATLNPHKIQELFGAAIMEQLPKIQAERPEILQKFQQLETTPLEELLKPLARLGLQ